MRLKHDKQISYYYGKDRYTKTWHQVDELWSDFAAKLMAHRSTGETMAEWKAMPKEKKDVIKDVGGFVGGILKEGKRTPTHVLARTFVCLDADSGESYLWDAFVMMYDCAAVMYQTHSWRPDVEKVRLVIPLSREVEPMLYKAISVHMVHELGEAQFDPTTHETNRLMFLPSLPRDAEHRPLLNDEAFFDVDQWVADHPRWADVSSWPVSPREEKNARKQIEKLGDPREKKGIIGAFCRTYDVPAAIDTFLSDRYVPGSSEDRYTWVGGSTGNGLHILDDGQHCLSHHATDPCGGQVVNSWDLVRIHLFGIHDEDAGDDKKSNNMMREFADADARVGEQLDLERGRAVDAFNDDGKIDPYGMFYRYDVARKALVFKSKLVADWYTGLQPVAQMGGELYRYENGKYVKADGHFKRLAATALDLEYTNSKVADSLSYLLSTAPEILCPFGGTDEWLNVRNGLLDCSTGELVPHGESFYSTVQLPWDYDPSATCPTVVAFIEEYAGEYAELVWYMIAYTLMGTTRFEKSFILTGHGGNGKGTTLHLISEMLGLDNVSNISLHKLESNAFAASGIVGKIANIQMDLPSKLLDAEGVVKQLISGDRIWVERKGKDGFSTTPRAKLLFSANELSASKDNSNGFYRRWCIIPFNKEFNDAKMRSQMFTEIPGLLAEAVKYAIKLSKLKSFPGSGEVEKMREMSDTVYAFIREKCQKVEGAKTTKEDAYQAYIDYCREEGTLPVKKKTFGVKLKLLFDLEEVRTEQQRLWKDLEIRCSIF